MSTNRVINTYQFIHKYKPSKSKAYFRNHQFIIERWWANTFAILVQSANHRTKAAVYSFKTIHGKIHKYTTNTKHKNAVLWMCDVLFRIVRDLFLCDYLYTLCVRHSTQYVSSLFWSRHTFMHSRQVHKIKIIFASARGVCLFFE